QIEKYHLMKKKEKPKDTDNNPEALLIRHMEQLLNEQNPTPHELILQLLLELIVEIDFQALAFPQVIALREQLMNSEMNSAQAKTIESSIEKMKLSQKHYIVLSV